MAWHAAFRMSYIRHSFLPEHAYVHRKAVILPFICLAGHDGPLAFGRPRQQGALTTCCLRTRCKPRVLCPSPASRAACRLRPCPRVHHRRDILYSSVAIVAALDGQHRSDGGSRPAWSVQLIPRAHCDPGTLATLLGGLAGRTLTVTAGLQCHAGSRDVRSGHGRGFARRVQPPVLG